MAKQMLTDRTLKALKPAPQGKRIMIWDAAAPHLAVRVTDKGTRSWVVVRRRPGDRQPIYHVLGKYPGVSLAQARAAAVLTLGNIARGIHPAEVSAQQRREREHQQANTFALGAEAFLEDERARGLRTAHETAAFLQREFLGRRRAAPGTQPTWVNGPEPIWRDKPVAEITRRDIIARLDQIKRRSGKHAARHALAAIRKFFNWCEEGERYGVGASPCARIRDKTIGITGRDLQRKRVLDDAELRDVWQAAAGLGYPYGRLVQLLVLTGQRVNDIARAKWSELTGLDASGQAVLRVPPERYKTGIGQQVPLPPLAVEIVSTLPRFGGNGYVFTTTASQRPISGLSEMKKRLDSSIEKLRQTAGVQPMPPWVLHDLRRTVRTRLVGDCHVEAFIAERVIGHTLPGLHGVYDQGTHLSAKRDALARWERRLLSIINPPPANVVALRVDGRQ